MCNEGEILYHWRSKTPLEKIKKVFNLSELDCGNYILCINYGDYSVYKELKVKNDEIQVGPVIQLYKPYFCYEENVLKLSFLNTAQRDVYLNIYQKNECINHYKLGRNLTVQKIFDFSKLTCGEYDLVLSDFFTEHHFLVNK